MKKIFFFLITAVFFASGIRDVSATQRRGARAGRREKPKVILNVDMGDIRYFYKKQQDIKCNTPTAAGCTHSEMYGNFAVLSGSKGIVGLVVNIGFKDFIVDVASEYPKGSCEFDLILKHELTHVALARAVVERYSAELGAAEAGDNLRILRDRYLNGMCTLTDLLDAQSQWQQAESNLIDARTQCKIYETEYLRVTGRLE